MALGDSSGIVTLNVNKSVDTNSLLKSRKIGATSDEYCRTLNTIEVSMTTVDAYCEKNHISDIDILKLDVQGSEMKVLKGAKDLLERGGIRAVYTEAYFQEQYVSQPLFHEIASYLYEHNFVLQDIYDPYFSLNSMLWCDALFIKKDIA